MESDAARDVLGMDRAAHLTRGTIERAYARATFRARAATDAGEYDATPSVIDIGAVREVLLRRIGRMPPRGDDLTRLMKTQFFLGGFVLFLTAGVLLPSLTTAYDGGLSLVGWLIGSVVIAVASTTVVFVLGWPLRVMPRLRRVWLTAGWALVAGVVLSLAAVVVLFVTAPTHAVADVEVGTYLQRDVWGWPLLIAWTVYAFCVAHFVAPLRWTRPGPTI